MKPYFIDFHCHPDIKSYGKSFNDTPGQNSLDPDDDNSIWHKKEPNLLSKLIQDTLGIAKFTQSDFQSAVKGLHRLVCASLYPIEQPFFKNGLGGGDLSKLADSFISGAGKKRVNFIMDNNDYFADLQNLYNYYQQIDGQFVTIGTEKYAYKLINNYAEMASYIATNEGADKVLFVIITIEGMHVLNSNIAAANPSEAEMLSHLDTIKSWPQVPFFVTFCHHFYNHLCGHARSLLEKVVDDATDQETGLDEPFTELGWKVLDSLLDNSGGKKRIYIDVKHMSIKGRRQYYAHLAEKYTNEQIPVIISHGAANGRRSVDQPDMIDGVIGAKLKANDINFYDDEILQVARTGGIFGLQLDENRLASKQTIDETNHSIDIRKIRHVRAELLWNQIQHIAELLDRNDLNAWDCLVMGTDSDGIVNPLNGFLTLNEIPDLFKYVWTYADSYMRTRGAEVLKPKNIIVVDDIMNKIFHVNGDNFLKKWFV